MASRKRSKDPFLAREKAEYEHPVASREFIMQTLADAGKPLGWQALCQALEIHSDEEQEGLRRRLKAMVRDGQLISNRRGSYALVQKLDLISGRIQAHRDGFGFLIPDDGSADVFIPAREMDAVFNDDRVLVRVVGLDSKKRREGQIAEIVEHNTHQVVGKYREEDGIAFVDPDNKLITQDIIIPENQRGLAQNGQFVMIEIIAQPTKRRQPLGKVIEVLGDQLTPGMEVELAIRSHNLPFVWPEAVLQEAQRFATTVSPEDIKNRTDLRHLPFVTIDGEDAKDFDDAVFCQRLPNKNRINWKLWVAIADVGQYVQPGNALDAEAKNRGNSVYFPNKVLPMLPESLSNGLCSLKPNVDRLVVVCEMDIDSQGVVLDYKFYEAVIHSQARLTYTQVANMLQEPKQAPQNIFQHLKEFNDLYKKLAKQRQTRGALEFDTTETKIVFGGHGKIDKIIPLQRNDAHRMIEEAMLLANVCAAHFLMNKVTTLYRVHEGPEPARLLALREFLRTFGLRLSGGSKPTAKDYAKLIQRIEGRPDSHLLQTVLLRSLRQAVYSPENSGHFGLAYDAYTHFTSPIRRYPDLLVHRGIKYELNKKAKPNFIYTEKHMAEMGLHCSQTERRADLSTRDAVDWLKCEYMLNKQGQKFPGIITDVTGFGVFVELNDIYIQGLLHVTSLPNDYYQYESTNHLLRGRHSGNVYQLGNQIEVIVARVDIDKRTIDFELPFNEKQKPFPRRHKKTKHKKKSRK